MCRTTRADPPGERVRIRILFLSEDEHADEVIAVFEADTVRDPITGDPVFPVLPDPPSGRYRMEVIPVE